MKLSYQRITICLLFAATRIVAEMDYFSSPGPNSHYKSGDTISFVVEDMPDEDDQNVNANLYKADQTLVKTIQTWNSQNVDESGEEFSFQWLVDVTESGQYYVEISVGTNRDDVTQSYPFTIQVDEEDAAFKEESKPEPNQSDYAQQMPEEDDTPTQKNKLSLHNKQSQVAHIASHKDIGTLSDTTSELEPQSKLVQLTSSLASNLPLGHHQVEPLMPKTSPTADMKELAAADDIAVAREKKWIAHQQQMEASSHKTPSKHLKSTQKAKHHHNTIQKEIASQAKKGVAKGKTTMQKQVDRQKLTLAQQEAKDDQESNKQSSSHHNNQHAKHSSKQKREAYRIIMRNRAKFSKQDLQ